jgi:hypothetical protein
MTRAMIGLTTMFVELDRNIEMLICIFSIGYYIKVIETILSMFQ